MAGRGPRPKDPDKRARRNSDPVGSTVLALKPAAQPKLPLPPKWMAGGWPKQTRAWWLTWGESAQADTMTATDWDFLLDTALLHAAVWLGDYKQAGELRLRVAKFGATVEDRARLRMQAEQGDEPDAAPADAPVSARSRYGHLRALPGTVTGG